MKRRAPKALLLSAVLLTLLAAGDARTARGQSPTPTPPAGAATATPTPTPTPDPKAQFEIDKLKQEIEGLKISNESLDARYKWVTTWITAFGGIAVTLLGVFVGLYFNVTQNRKLMQDKRLGREEHLLKVFHDLGDKEPRIRIGAVAVLTRRVRELTRQMNESKDAPPKRGWFGLGRPEIDPEEVKELPTIVSVLISVTKHEKSIEIQKYIADGIAGGLDAILDPEQAQRDKKKKAKHVVSPLKKYDFQGAQLQNAWWYSIDARGVDFYKANLGRASLRDSLLEGAILKNADLSLAQLTNANLEGANLEGAKLVNANLKGARLVNARLKGADLKGAKLDQADVTGVDFSGVENLYAASGLDLHVASPPLTSPP